MFVEIGIPTSTLINLENVGIGRAAVLSRVGFADVAQLVEQLFCKQRVGGSIPLVGFLLILARDPELASIDKLSEG